MTVAVTTASAEDGVLVANHLATARHLPKEFSRALDSVPVGRQMTLARALKLVEMGPCPFSGNNTGAGKLGTPKTSQAWSYREEVRPVIGDGPATALPLKGAENLSTYTEVSHSRTGNQKIK
ncbi:hypothetical protein AVEN_120775-1 [Araneus ventricosus]|uniref:Uncharacterized protein n=1 Tax=Araneus ventricosus TaxID=182803 RepID=A0A4Y2QXL8_ARAVE|nr:hypothetical protein AVEN_120775-1 [Araneus ventricosus]